MMVIQGAVATATSGADLAIGDIRIFPADRCIWSQIDTVDSDSNPTGGYSIENAAFVGLTHTTAGNGEYIRLTSAQLGFVGKSGRFVPISN